MATKKNRKSKPAYKQRLILFIDFLGFKEHVERTEKEPEFLGRLIGAMDRIGKIARDDRQFHRSQTRA